ncbi:hypothetical protein EON65_22375 [archaeon]|nr:MAG: hypothetical protein EON65_22375 [archaeon]
MKEQCRNCTFLNGQFADECEMCGEPLSRAGQERVQSKGGNSNSRSLFDSSSSKPPGAASRYTRKDAYY